MQSLAFGTPIITHGDFDRQSPEWEALIPGETGDVFECGDTGSLARTIRKWIEGNPDREQVAERCYRVMDLYFNPAKQREVIDRAVEGMAAEDDEYWEARIV